MCPYRYQIQTGHQELFRLANEKDDETADGLASGTAALVRRPHPERMTRIRGDRPIGLNGGAGDLEPRTSSRSQRHIIRRRARHSKIQRPCSVGCGPPLLATRSRVGGSAVIVRWRAVGTASAHHRVVAKPVTGVAGTYPFRAAVRRPARCTRRPTRGAGTASVPRERPALTSCRN